jgi:dTDP-4-dehydrorhamnose 3,5-epimerase
VNFRPTRIPDVVLVEPKVFGDARGYFMETWRESLFSAHGIGPGFVQDNQSGSGQWTLRGLHYQLRQAQGKLVRVIHGSVFDVAVDLRRGSPTFGQWVGETLSEENRRQMWVPPGFAHGFLVLSESAEFVYKCTDYYAPEHERALRWDDPEVGIEWPLPPGVQPVVSDKDADAPLLGDVEVYA